MRDASSQNHITSMKPMGNGLCLHIEYYFPQTGFSFVASWVSLRTWVPSASMV